MTRSDDDRRPTPLACRLAEEISAQGPMRLSNFMARCLLDDTHGYYRSRIALGRDGDFITAPEISQVFGELVGLWTAVTWQQMGAPDRLRLIEFGAGRGTLLADMLRATTHVPGFLTCVEVDIVEINPMLRELQRKVLDRYQPKVSWHEHPGQIAPGSARIIIANEFLDTLPIDQWRLHEGRPEQAVVTQEADGRLSFGWAPAIHDTIHDALQQLPGHAAVILETRNTRALAETLSAWSDRAPLAALFIDYGQNGPATRDTLQAVRAHHCEHPLTSPGEADLTSQVDFAAFARDCAARGLAADGPVAQAQFLGSLGIVERASRLMAANPSHQASIEAGVARLLSPTGMGSRFHALGVRSPGLPPLAGLSWSRT